jgi:hypothetical protein
VADIQKSTFSGLQIITLKRGAFHEYFMTSVPDGNEPEQSLFQIMADVVRARKAHVISQEVLPSGWLAAETCSSIKK